MKEIFLPTTLYPIFIENPTHDPPKILIISTAAPSTMHFFSLSTLAIASSITSLALSTPILVERQTPSDAPAALVIVDQLFTDVTQYTAVISTSHLHPSTQKESKPPKLTSKPTDSTAASLTADSSATDNVTAADTFTSAIASINTLVVDATSSVEALADTDSTTKRALANALAGRQADPADPTGLAGELAAVIEEIGGALNNIIATLGLSKLFLSFSLLEWL